MYWLHLACMFYFVLILYCGTLFCFYLVSRNWIIFDVSVLHNVDDPTYHVDLLSIRLYKTTTKPIFSSLAYHCSSFSSNFTYSVLNKAIIFFITSILFYFYQKENHDSWIKLIKRIWDHRFVYSAALLTMILKRVLVMDSNVKQMQINGTRENF